MQTARHIVGAVGMTLPLPERAGLYAVHPFGDAPPLAPDARHVVVCAKDTGGTEALLPVLRELHANNIGTTAIAAGVGLRILQERGRQHNLRLSDPLDGWPSPASHPGGLLLTPSVAGDLEETLLAWFPRTPAAIVEDYYESSRHAVKIAAETGRSLPTVCAVDSEAKRLIRDRFTGLGVPVKVTGSPTFDALAGEDVAATQARSRKELAVPPNEKLIAFLMPHLGESSLRLAQGVAGAFQEMGGEYMVALRPHPSDPVPLTEYEKLFEDVRTRRTVGIPTDTVANAADLVVAGRSVAARREAVRQRFTVTLEGHLARGFTSPLAEIGASVPASPDELPELIPELLQGVSPRCENLRQAMAPLRSDGRAAARVAAVCAELFKV